MHAAHELVGGCGAAISNGEHGLHAGFFNQSEFGLVIAVGISQALQRCFQRQGALRLHVVAHERAASALGQEQTFARQDLDGLAHGHTRYLEFIDQRLQRRHFAARRPSPARNALAQQIGQLRIQGHRAVGKDGAYGREHGKDRTSYL